MQKDLKKMNKTFKYDHKKAYPDNKREYGSKMIFSVLCRGVSPFLTRIALLFRLTPNAVTFLSIFLGVLGCFFIFNSIFFLGAFCATVGYILDYVDGSLARVTGKTSIVGSLLEGINSNLQYLLLIPSTAFGLYKQGVIVIEVVFFSVLACAGYVSVRGIFNRNVPINNNASFFKKIIFCQFKGNNDLRLSTPFGALLYYLRYNILAQNGIMYPALVICSVFGGNALVSYLYYYIILYIAFFVCIFTSLFFVSSWVKFD